jgi:hypothetical protein
VGEHGHDGPPDTLHEDVRQTLASLASGGKAKPNRAGRRKNKQDKA